MIIQPASPAGPSFRTRDWQAQAARLSRSPRPATSFALGAGSAAIASQADAIGEAGAAWRVEEEPAFQFAAPAPVDAAILDRFADDLAVAPELAGELTALYVEQYPRSAVALTERALRVGPAVAEEIRVSAARRAAAGLRRLAQIMAGALDLALIGDVLTESDVLNSDDQLAWERFDDLAQPQLSYSESSIFLGSLIDES